jgi:uncharacterized DUF497 family protein
MRITWDERKNGSNQRKHGLSFETAVLVFDDPLHISVKDREVDGEERWQTIGTVGGVMMLLVVHTVEDEDEEEMVRIISARKPTPQERRTYAQAN